MAVTSILSFTASAPTHTIIEELTQALDTSHGLLCYVVGTGVQEPTMIQITSDWSDFSTTTELSSSQAFKSFIEVVNSLAHAPITIAIAELDKSTFARGTPPLVEYVKTHFPVKSFTPEFQQQIETDFAKFEAIFRRRGTAEETGEVVLSVGWTEAQDDVRSFLVVRGWENMGRFDEAVKSEVFQECIPILLEWNAPFELWHVERKVHSKGL